jgi:hypothetical protein
MLFFHMHVIQTNGVAADFLEILNFEVGVKKILIVPQPVSGACR